MIHQKVRRRWLPLLTSALLGACASGETGTANAADKAPVYDRQVNLIYTINNVGYTSTCG